MSERREEIEQGIRLACERRDFERATTLALETYGREVLGFLIARTGEQRGNEVFSDLLEDFWKGLPRFAWRSSLRSWTYTLARHALARYARGAQRRREAVLATNASVLAVAERVRSETANHMRTPVKNRFRELRAQLSDDNQNLLILRIDRNLSWRELAAVMSDAEEPPSDEELDKSAARLRQRFQAAKDKLRKLAEAEGLVPRKDEA